LEFQAPRAHFARPGLTATINIPDEALRSETTTAAVPENIDQVITSVTGLERQVSVLEPPEEQ
jgi:hypothetical protein